MRFQSFDDFLWHIVLIMLGENIARLETTISGDGALGDNALSFPEQIREDSGEPALLFLGSDAARVEALELLRSAAMSDETHVRSRLYLASELTRAGEKDEAIQLWQQAMEMAVGDEPWLEAARQGLAVARGGGDATLVDETEMISGMVEGLQARLFADGGSVEEWTQLVRSYLVLNDPASAQRSYDAAVSAYPMASARQDLDALASDAGLATEGEGE